MSLQPNVVPVTLTGGNSPTISTEISPIYVDPNNNYVGIGTTNPTSALHIIGTVTATSYIGSLSGNVTGNCSGTAANVTGTVAVANGGTGSTAGANTAGGVVLLNGSAQMPAVDGSLLTNMPTFPSGGIIMWHGSIATIPSGWYLCNGSNGTPDLRNQFIVGADNDVAGQSQSSLLGSEQKTGGSTSIQANQIPSLALNAFNIATTSWNSSSDGYQFGTGVVTGSTNFGMSTVGGNTPYAPPFYALAFIMKS